MIPITSDMKKHLGIIAIVMLPLVLPLTANAQWRLRNVNHGRYRISNLFIGARSEVASSFYDYSALNDESANFPLALNYGLGIEWVFSSHLSIGLDAMHSERKASMSFSTPYLISYTETSVTDITFAISEKCIDLNMPFTLYYISKKHWLTTYSSPYLFVAPNLCLMYGGTLRWTRTHLNDATVLASYEIPLSNASSSGYDYGLRVGIGTTAMLQIGSYPFMAKAALTGYFGMHNTFSDLEKDNLLPTDHYYGLGDITHEQLGERFIRQVSLSVAVFLPFHEKPKDACYSFDKNRYK